jgi:hypothetical protein
LKDVPKKTMTFVFFLSPNLAKLLPVDNSHHGVVMAVEERSSQNPQQAARFPPAKIWSCK